VVVAWKYFVGTISQAFLFWLGLGPFPFSLWLIGMPNAAWQIVAFIYGFLAELRLVKQSSHGASS
jgi:hypothetical protein